MAQVQCVNGKAAAEPLNRRQDDELVNPLVMQARILGELDELFGRMLDSSAEQTSVHRQRAHLSQGEIENLYKNNAWLHKWMGTENFLLLAASALTHGIDGDERHRIEALSKLLQTLSKIPEIFKDTRIKQNEGETARFQTLKQIDDRDESTTRQTAQLVQSLTDDKKRLVEELARLLSESLKVKA